MGSTGEKQSFPAAGGGRGSLGFISLVSTARVMKTRPSGKSEPVWVASP